VSGLPWNRAEWPQPPRTCHRHSLQRRAEAQHRPSSCPEPAKSDRPTVAEKRHRFRALHASGCFLMPNPRDVGSARWLQSLGFAALATTSSGFAWSISRADARVGLEPVLAHLRAMVEATDVPINADFENGYAADAQGVADHVARAVATGVAGLSIEDSTGDAARPLFDLAEAVERLRAARSAIDAPVGSEAMAVGRPRLAAPLEHCRAALARAGVACGRLGQDLVGQRHAQRQAARVGEEAQEAARCRAAELLGLALVGGFVGLAGVGRQHHELHQAEGAGHRPGGFGRGHGGGLGLGR
jgi:2-methylisocitrate lyase-like PEP mutase family enzyme